MGNRYKFKGLQRYTSPTRLEHLFNIWTPAALFSAGQQGVWYEPRPEHLYQDSAGTEPVTADGQPVGYMEDSSPNDHDAAQSTASRKTIYRTNDVLHWTSGDGVDDYIASATTATNLASEAFIFSFAARFDNADEFTFIAAMGNGTLETDFIGIRQRSGVFNLFVTDSAGAGTNIDGPAKDTFTHVFTMAGDGAGHMTLYVDGVEYESATIASINVSSLSVHALLRDSPGLYCASSFFGGIYVSGGGLSERVRIENHLANLAGITL